MRSNKKLLVSSLVTFLTMAVASAYPNLPQAVSEGGGALVGNTAYVGLGVAGDHFYSLDLDNANASWQTLPAFPGGPRKQPVVASVNGKIYVFGGLQVVNGTLQLINDAYSYDPAKNQWMKLPTRAPIGLVGTSSFVRNGKIYFVGGSNTPIFNGIFADLTAAKSLPKDQQASATSKILDAYFDKPAQDYFFNRTFVSYDPATNSWENLGLQPFPGRAGAAVASDGKSFVVVNGEIKPGLRTSRVEQGFFTPKGVQYIQLADLTQYGQRTTDADGVAGAYAGYLNGQLYVVGGASFPGAMHAYKQGHYYSHKGLTKTYVNNIYTLKDGNWEYLGKLPETMGYGVALPYNGKLLLISGYTAGKNSTTAVYTLSPDGASVKVDK